MRERDALFCYQIEPRQRCFQLLLDRQQHGGLSSFQSPGERKEWSEGAREGVSKRGREAGSE